MNERNQLNEPAQSEDQPVENENGALFQFFGTAKQVMDRYSHCALCGAHLHFTHVTDFSRNLTQESARCPECGVKARRALHKLQ